MTPSRPVVVGIDAGGTMTDTILVDERGQFTIGKAATTPKLEAKGFLESAEEASQYHEMDVGTMFRKVDVVLYSGTGMLNVLLSRTGRKIGLIATKGMEDMVLMGRGLQSWCDYSYADRLHAVTHHHPEPLVSRRNTLGVTERVDHMGDVIIPLYENEAKTAIRDLIDREVEAICICLLFSHVNPAHERRIVEIAEELLGTSSRQIDIYASHVVRPVIREQSRMNSVLIEAYATGRGRKQLKSIEDVARAHGFRYGVQTLQSFGGLTSINHPHLHETMVSGPIGGILGAQYVGKLIGTDSLVVSDLGGTSFDMGIITKGQTRIDHEPVMGRFKLNLPMIAMDTIGAGAGMLVKVDPLTRKIGLGPESAGSEPGPVCFGLGNLEPTICDCDAILGWLNPDYFLGGRVPLNVELAKQQFKSKCADLLGIDDIYEAAEGIVAMLEAEAQTALRRLLSSQGVHPSEYSLLSYGGSGPLHLAGYSRGLGFKDVLTFQFAAAFSAFGCTTADYQKRFGQSVQLEVKANQTGDQRNEISGRINTIWRNLTERALEQMGKDGHDEKRVEFHPALLMRFSGQLEDVEIRSPVSRINDDEDLEAIVQTFRDIYGKINRSVSNYGQSDVTIMELGLTASVAKIKPRLVRRELGPSSPEDTVSRGSREAYLQGRWHRVRLWEMDRLKPGNEIHGPSIVEHPATTLVVHPGDQVFMDEWSLLHYRHQ